jgi:hypothetical protein
MDSLNTALRSRSFSTRNLRGANRTKRHDTIAGGTAEQGRLDANLSSRSMGIFFDEKGMDHLIEIFNETSHIEAVLNGDMDIRTAVQRTVQDSHRKLGRLQADIIRPMDEQVTNVSGKKRHRVDIPGTSITPSGRTGDPPQSPIETTSFIDNKIDKEEQKFGLKSGSTRAQLAYCEFELDRIRTSTRVDTSINHIVRKATKSPFIHRAWIHYIQQNRLNEVSLMDGSINSIREYLQDFFLEN